MLNQQHCGLRRRNNLKRRRIIIKIRNSGELGFYMLSRKNSFFGESFSISQYNGKLIETLRSDQCRYGAMGSKRQLKCMNEIGYSRPSSSQADGKKTANLKQTVVAGHHNCNRETNQTNWMSNDKRFIYFKIKIIVTFCPLP